MRYMAYVCLGTCVEIISTVCKLDLLAVMIAILYIHTHVIFISIYTIYHTFIQI